ncbi:MAG: hypothetical protein NVS1B7_7770 [Candidatus Saccharimonadales bacterium]
MDVKQYYERPRINLTGAVNEKMIEDLDRQVRMVLPVAEPAVLTLTSGGGSVGYARAIFEELSLLQQHIDVSFVARGMCLSAAVTIAMAFPKDKRFATRHTKFLIHEGIRDHMPTIVGPLSAREIQLENFQNDFADDHDELKWVLGAIAKGCQQPMREVRREARQGLWLIGNNALKYGLVSQLL